MISGHAESSLKEKGLLLLNAKPGETILEIGFGTGHCLLNLAQVVGDTGKIYGIDLSEGMLQAAQAKLRKAGVMFRVDLRQGDALQLPYADSFFDAIYVSFTLELFDSSEIPSLLKECKRVLHANGRISIVSMAKREKQSLMVRLYTWSHRKWPVYIDCRPIDGHAVIDQVGFHIEQLVQMSLFGLPVDIILARP